MKVFHTFGRFNLQCLKTVEFELNGQNINCAPLQKFRLQHNFTLKYQNEQLKAQVLINHNKKLSSTWMGEYTFGNIPLSYLPATTPQDNFFPEAIHQIIFTEAGSINIQGVSLFTSGTAIFVLLLCATCCYKSEKFRDFWKNWITKSLKKLYSCFTSEKFKRKKKMSKCAKKLK